MSRGKLTPLISKNQLDTDDTSMLMKTHSTDYNILIANHNEVIDASTTHSFTPDLVQSEVGPTY